VGPAVLTVTANPALDHTLWVPGFRAGDVNRVERDVLTPGGKGVNVATVLASLGVVSSVSGFLGEDNAALFESYLAERELEDRFVRLPGRTRTGIKVIDPDAVETTDINFPGLTPSAAAIDELVARVREAAGSARWVALCGSLPPGVDAGLYRRLVDAARDAGASVALDTSGAALAAAVSAAPAIIKPNRAELEALVGRRLSDEAALLATADDLRADGIETVIVSLGADGALFATPDGAVLARPPDVTVVSTVGAGDSMVAGVIAGDLAGLTLADTAALATACSAVAISGIGADLDRGRVDAAALDVKIETLR